MMTATFGREFADSRHRQLVEQAEHDRLVGRLRRGRDRHEPTARRPVPGACPRDVG